MTEAQLIDVPMMEEMRLIRDLGINPLAIIAILKAALELWKLIKALFA
jgi:hypothetical protein